MAKINKEISIAVKNGTFEEILERFGISLLDEPVMAVNTRKMKILVLGELAGKLKEYQLVAKKSGINQDNIEFINYVEAKKLNASRLQYSNEYSDIICGPIPHKIEGMGDTSSLLALMENNPSKYPKLQKATANSALKITITRFRELLFKTRYFEALSQIA